MLPLKLPPRRWHYIIILATVLQISLLFWSDDGTLDPDLKLALKRAKTESCRKELYDLGVSHVPEEIQLKRTCKLDSNEPRNLKVSCASRHSLGIVEIAHPVDNSSDCFDSCFSYGHSHGGFDEATTNCFCGDNDFSNGSSQTLRACSDGEFDWFHVNNGVYTSKKSPWLQQGVPTESSQVKIAFLLMLNGRGTSQVERILKNIYSKNHIYYIHVDKREDYLYGQLLQLESIYDNIIVTRSRFRTIWGGTSSLRMISDAIDNLSHHDWDFLINLSESDFPIKSLQSLEDYLSPARNKIFLKSHSMKGYNFIKKQGLDRRFYQCEDRVWLVGTRRLPKGIIFSGGSDWFALPRNFCMYIRDNATDSNGLVKPLLQLYNQTLLPAESFFHTLAINSEFCDRFHDNNLRITNWRRKQGCKCQHRDVVDWCGCSPLIYRSSNLDKLMLTKNIRDVFFSRKFDPTVSSSIINSVEKHLIREEHTQSGQDTRYWQNLYTFNETSYIDSHEVGSILDQIYKFSSQQTRITPEQTLTNQINIVDSYFKGDRFVGLVFHYCVESVCYQFLLEKRANASTYNYNSSCLSSGDKSLKVVEVNHGFDTGERMFRNYRPMDINSDIVVYHEWHIGAREETVQNETDKSDLRFYWSSPGYRIELAQNVKFRRYSKPTKLTLAHRLSKPKPLAAGLWTLTISNGNHDCLDYKFLIFDKTSFSEKKVSQATFDRFYTVSDICLANGRVDLSQHPSNCQAKEWSSVKTELTLD